MNYHKITYPDLENGLGVRITIWVSGCMHQCKGCHNPETWPMQSGKPFTSETVQELCNLLDKYDYLDGVTFSGGDPLTRKDFSRILSECKKLCIKVNLDTVGLTFTKARKIPSLNIKVDKFLDINSLDGVDYVGIPLDGSNNGIVSKFRIYEGDLFGEILSVLNLLDKNCINVCVNTVLHKHNLKDLENIYNIINKYDCVKKWQIFQFMPIGSLGSKNAKMFVIDDKDFDDAKLKINSLNDKGLIINFKSAAERAKNYMLVNSAGVAYRVDLNNNVVSFGNIADKSSWDNIINNLS